MTPRRSATPASRSRLAGLVALFAAGPALACRCAPQPTPRAQLRAADVAFVGTVLATRRLNAHQSVTTFTVVEPLRGAPGRMATVNHSADICCVCGVDYTPGARVVVLAHREGAALQTSSCARGRWTDAELRAAAGRR